MPHESGSAVYCCLHLYLMTVFSCLLLPSHVPHESGTAVYCCLHLYLMTVFSCLLLLSSASPMTGHSCISRGHLKRPLPLIPPMLHVGFNHAHSDVSRHAAAFAFCCPPSSRNQPLAIMHQSPPAPSSLHPMACCSQSIQGQSHSRMAALAGARYLAVWARSGRCPHPPCGRSMTTLAPSP